MQLRREMHFPIGEALQCLNPFPDAAFAINDTRDEVVVRSLRRLSALDYEEFEDILATVGEVADRLDDELIRDFGT